LSSIHIVHQTNNNPTVRANQSVADTETEYL